MDLTLTNTFVAIAIGFLIFFVLSRNKTVAVTEDRSAAVPVEAELKAPTSREIKVEKTVETVKKDADAVKKDSDVVSKVSQLAHYEATATLVALTAYNYIKKEYPPVVTQTSVAGQDVFINADIKEVNKEEEINHDSGLIIAVAKPKPFLADFEGTTAMCLLEAQGYTASLPKAPRPCLAAYNATVASTALEAQQYISSLPKAPKPFLAQFEATTALTLLESQQYIASLPTASPPTTQQAIPSTSSQLASFEATIELQHYTEKQEQESSTTTSDSDVEVEIEQEGLTSPATTPSTSTSSLHSEAFKFATTAATSTSKQQTTWHKILNDRALTIEPSNLNILSITIPAGGGKRMWTREEKILKQSQHHMPKMKNRCDYWPNCTNKHCKFSHPTLPCRIGDGCPFGPRCSFIHPVDYIDPPPKKHFTTKGTTQTNTKRASSDPSFRSNITYPSKTPLQNVAKELDTPPAQLSV